MGKGWSVNVLEILVITLGTSVAKYLVKELLPTDWQDEIAADFLSKGIEWLTTKRPDPVGAAIGERVKGFYDRSRLPEHEKESVVHEVARTLATAKTTLPHLAELDLDAEKLRRQLIDARPEVAQELSADADALYKQMLRAAAEGIVATVDKVDGFLRVNLSEILSRQTTQGEQLEEVLALLKAGDVSLSEDLKNLIIDLVKELKREQDSGPEGPIYPHPHPPRPRPPAPPLPPALRPQPPLHRPRGGAAGPGRPFAP